VGAVSLLAAAWGVTHLLRGGDGSPTWPAGLALVAVIVASYLLARRLAARPAPASMISA
jgi:hypothetical protein